MKSFVALRTRFAPMAAPEASTKSFKACASRCQAFDISDRPIRSPYPSPRKLTASAPIRRTDTSPASLRETNNLPGRKLEPRLAGVPHSD